MICTPLFACLQSPKETVSVTWAFPPPPPSLCLHKRRQGVPHRLESSISSTAGASSRRPVGYRRTSRCVSWHGRRLWSMTAKAEHRSQVCLTCTASLVGHVVARRWRVQLSSFERNRAQNFFGSSLNRRHRCWVVHLAVLFMLHNSPIFNLFISQLPSLISLTTRSRLTDDRQNLPNSQPLLVMYYIQRRTMVFFNEHDL